MNWVMQPGRENGARNIVANKPQLRIRPPRMGGNLLSARHDPSPWDPKVREVSRLQNLAPIGLPPVRAQLFVVLDNEYPVAVAGARHRAQVPDSRTCRRLLDKPDGAGLFGFRDFETGQAGGGGSAAVSVAGVG